MNLSAINFYDLYQPHKDLFERYAALLIKWNQKINLTSIVDSKEIEELHFLDSISVSALLPNPIVSRETSVLDIGAGAGFPGIPLKIIWPEIQLTLVDSVKKKCDFMKEAIRFLGLHDVEVVHQRLTERNQIGKFDIVVSRAAFKMRDFIFYASPNLREGGVIVGMKGKEVSEEIKECDPLLQLKNLSQIEQSYYTLPISGQVRSLLVTRRL